jgi:glycosyltransferase involved in cell wall biosynthesis
MRIVSYPDNVGYGYAIKTGVAATDSDYVAITDADATYPPEALPKMLEMCLRADMIVGDRGAAMSNVPMIRRPAKWVLNNLANYLAGRKINDLNSGLRVFKRSSLEQFTYLLPDGFSLTTTITLCMLSANMKIIYEPIIYGKRVGHSKMRASQFFNFLLLVVRITVFFQPLRVFLPLGAALFLMGVAKAVYDVSLDNLSESAVLGLLGAVMVWSLGLLADMIARLAQRR